MAITGPYDEETRRLLKRTGAEGVVVVVIGGKFGDAFSVAGPASLHLRLPELLRTAAAEAEAHLESEQFAASVGPFLSPRQKQ